MTFKILSSTLTDPFTNLAIENSLLAQITEPTLFLYQNSPCVVIGRGQNPWLETDVLFLQQNNIPLLRRQSGGGTVVHDLGNLNFCFLSPKAAFDKMQNIQFVQHILSTLGRAVEIGEKYDLLFEGKKVSGSAFRETTHNCFHHGTLLLESDLDFVRRCLQVPPTDIVTKSVRSRLSAVTNLGLEISAVKTAFAKTCPVSTLFIQDLQASLRLYQSHEWIYGKAVT